MDLQPNSEVGRVMSLTAILTGLGLGSLAWIEYQATGNFGAIPLVEAAIGLLAIFGGIGGLFQSAPTSMKL